ncbi:hypothetical protein QN277_015883 [Acacia crassicarpa]|uniref:Uncharacterized protein n=1 Tax=Acacia crassicarpa TaxID=499986 RepID=A0AAE1KMJ9_9FABA|nr:hypothetical protein QN277_015883 [Acacia crassicarpa]
MIYPQKFTTILLLFLFFIPCPFCIGESPPAAAPPPVDDSEMKCGSCPCRSSCDSGGSSSSGGGQELPIPSPPPPSPPPPSLTYLSSQNCDQSPPPPAPRFIYVTGGEPGNVPYQTQPYNWGNYNSAARSTHMGLLILVAFLVCMASS